MRVIEQFLPNHGAKLAKRPLHTAEVLDLGRAGVVKLLHVPEHMLYCLEEGDFFTDQWEIKLHLVPDISG